MNAKYLIIIGSFLTFFISCQPGNESRSKTASEQTDDVEIENIEKVYLTMSRAYATFDIALIEQIYADDAFNIYAGDSSEIKHLRKNFIEGFQKTFNYHNEKGNTMDLKFKIIKREIENKMAYDVGYFRIDLTDKKGSKSKGRPGKFVTVLKKQEDNTWKFQVDIYGDAPTSAFTVD